MSLCVTDTKRKNVVEFPHLLLFWFCFHSIVNISEYVLVIFLELTPSIPPTLLVYSHRHSLTCPYIYWFVPRLKCICIPDIPDFFCHPCESSTEVQLPLLYFASKYQRPYITIHHTRAVVYCRWVGVWSEQTAGVEVVLICQKLLS